MPPSATETVRFVPTPVRAPSPAASPRRTARWHQLVAILTDQRAARAHLRRLGLDRVTSTWT